MQSQKWIGNQGVVAVLMVVGVVTVGAIGWSFIDKKVSSSSWVNERIVLEKSLMLAQAEKTNLQSEFDQLKDKVQGKLESIQSNYIKLDAENRLLNEEKLTLVKERDLLKDKVSSVEGNTFFSDMLKEKAELEVAVGELKSALSEKDKQIAQLQEKSNQLVAQLSEGGKGDLALQKQLAEKDKVNSLLSKYLANEKKESKAFKAQLEALADEKSKIARQYDQLVSEKELAQRKLAEVSSTLAESAKEKETLQAKLASVYNVVNDRLGEIVKVKKDLESTMDETKNLVQKEVDEIELEPIVVRGNAGKKETTVAKAVPAAEPAQQIAAVEPQEEKEEAAADQLADEARVNKVISAATKKPAARMVTVAKAALPASGESTKELVGRVLVVNEKLNFIVVNLGANQGVQVGMKVAVMNKTNVIADTQVIEVRDNIAAADIQNLKLEGQIKEGDSVKIVTES